MPGRETAPQMVARRTELATLRAAVERARGGDAATVVVTGEAGIGKSRLVAELTRDDGPIVMLGRCVDIDGGELAYAPIAGALRALASQVDEPELTEVLGLVPALAEDSPRAQLYDRLLRALGRLGQARPVVLIIEDLQWADGATRDALRFLVRGAASERLALIITCRTGDLHRSDPLRPYLVELRRDARVECLDLQPFSSDEHAAQVAALLGELPAPASLNRLYERSEGNPYFTEELLRAGAETRLPGTLRDAVAVELERLPEGTQRVVRVLAAAGRRIDHRLLERLAPVPADELSEAIRGALDAGVLRTSEDGRDYEFRHGLLREAAYADILPAELADVHAGLARVLDADPELGGAAALAHHWHMAGENGRALRASVQAAHDATRAGAHREALGHLQRALELWEPSAPLDREQLAERAAEAAGAAGETQLAIALAQQAVEHAAPERASLQHARLARLLWDAGRGTEALPVSARAVESMSPERTAERAGLLESHARLLLLTGRAAEAVVPIEEALSIARELGAHDVEAAALATRVIALQGSAGLAAAGREALELAKRHGDADTLMRAYINAAEALDHGGRVEDAIDLAREGLEESRRLGLERVMGVQLQGEIAGRMIKLGHWEQAAATIADGLRTVPEGAAAVALHDAAALLAAQRRETAAVEAAFDRVDADEAGSGQTTARGSAALAVAALWDHDAPKAWAIVDEALELVRASEYVWYSAPLYALGAWALADEALSARAAADDDRAEAARTGAVALLARLDEQRLDEDAPEPMAYRAQVAAEIDRLLDSPRPAAWEAVRERWERLGFPFHVALCGWREAEAILLADGDRSRAAELLGDAARGAEAVGASALASEVQALARRARLAPRDDADAPPAELTPRELDVLHLMARGDTNREIGERLFISAKTVSVHVSRVLAKLGAANRAQAATIAHRLGIE